MRLQHRQLGIERGLDLGELDLPLRLDLEMDRILLGPLTRANLIREMALEAMAKLDPGHSKQASLDTQSKPTR
jgi:hypothetical protein